MTGSNYFSEQRSDLVHKEWLQYLNYIFNDVRINALIIYSDSDSYWLAKGLADAAKIKKWKVSVSLLDEISNEELIEISQSLPLVPHTTLFASIISNKNKFIDEINQIFPPLQAPNGFTGSSLVSLQHFPNQYFSHFLVNDYKKSQQITADLQAEISENSKISLISESGTDLSFTTASNLASYPFYIKNEKNHVLFPSTEIICQIDPLSIQGTLVVDISISEYIESGELIDPLGAIVEPIRLIFEHGEIMKIESQDYLADRLAIILAELMKDEVKITKFGIGVGPEIKPSGFVEVDKMIRNHCSFGLKENQLEFVITYSQIEVL